MKHDRSYVTPPPTARDHEDDDLHRWELRHGRIGAGRRDRDPMSSLLWFVLMVLAGCMVVLAGIVGANW